MSRNSKSHVSASKLVSTAPVSATPATPTANPFKCQICGKLIKPNDLNEGSTCLHVDSILKASGLKDRKELRSLHSVDAIPEGYRPHGDLVKFLKEHKIYTSKVWALFGGDRVQDKPIAEFLAPVYVKGKRYYQAKVFTTDTVNILVKASTKSA